MKKLLLMIAIVAVGFGSCTKEGPQGPKGDTGPQGPEAKTFDFSLYFEPGDEFKEYSGITGFTPGDMVITYVFNAEYGANYYVQTPFIVSGINFWVEVAEDNGHLFVNVTNADGSPGSPLSNPANFGFKAILI